ncbi:MAG: chemotaxis protein CheX [Terracidiphilus sp.]|jgi:CheY-specific phosphatase CheX
MRAQLDQQNVIKANAQFWEQMLAMTLEPTLTPEQFSVSAGHLFGCVTLTGMWKGRIEVRMAGSLAYEATAAMMMQPVETVGESDALDAIKEIANMIAGMIKSSLPRPCAMTVPESAVEREGYRGQPQMENSVVVAFRHAAGDLMVGMWKQECGQE